MTLLLIAAMLAGTDPATVPAEAQAEKPTKVCKAVMVSGSRLARRKVCLTEKQWAAEAAAEGRPAGRSTKERAN